jgi:hypothetical protein
MGELTNKLPLPLAGAYFALRFKVESKHWLKPSDCIRAVCSFGNRKSLSLLVLLTLQGAVIPLVAPLWSQLDGSGFTASQSPYLHSRSSCHDPSEPESPGK